MADSAMIRHLLILILSCTALHAESTPPTIHMIGDSTMANKKNPAHPERGWGQLFSEFIIPPAKLENRALNGRSTRSFINEKHWAALLTELKPGDWVIIQFGHNDQKSDNPKVHAAHDGAYRENLIRFITETRARSAFPILATSVVRRRWDAHGNFIDTLGEYPAATRAVAARENVPLLDLHQLTLKMESDAGIDGSAKFHFSKDDTHYSELGARATSALAAAEIHRLQLPLARWISLDPVAP